MPTNRDERIDKVLAGWVRFQLIATALAGGCALVAWALTAALTLSSGVGLLLWAALVAVTWALIRTWVVPWMDPSS